MIITTSNKKRIEAIEKVYGIIALSINKSITIFEDGYEETITAWYVHGFSSLDKLKEKLSDETIERLYDSGQ